MVRLYFLQKKNSILNSLDDAEKCHRHFFGGHPIYVYTFDLNFIRERNHVDCVREIMMIVDCARESIDDGDGPKTRCHVMSCHVDCARESIDDGD